MTLSYRKAEAADAPLIVSSWVESYRTAHAAGMISMADWAQVMTAQVLRVLARSGCEAWVAFHPGENDQRSDLYGWIAVESDVRIPARVREDGKWIERMEPAGCALVHYCYVKQVYRRMGIARGLFRSAGVDLGNRFLYTCKTAIVSELIRSTAPHAKWMPMIARYPKTEPWRTDETLPGKDGPVREPAGRTRNERKEFGIR